MFGLNRRFNLNVSLTPFAHSVYRPAPCDGLSGPYPGQPVGDDRAKLDCLSQAARALRVSPCVCTQAGTGDITNSGVAQD